MRQISQSATAQPIHPPAGRGAQQQQQSRSGRPAGRMQSASRRRVLLFTVFLLLLGFVVIVFGVVGSRLSFGLVGGGGDAYDHGDGEGGDPAPVGSGKQRSSSSELGNARAHDGDRHDQQRAIGVNATSPSFLYSNALASASVCNAELSSSAASMLTPRLAQLMERLGSSKESSETKDYIFQSNIASDWVLPAPLPSVSRGDASCAAGGPDDAQNDSDDEAAGSTDMNDKKGAHHQPSSSSRLPVATQRRYALCYHAQNRFLFFGNNWGRHSNQLTSLAAALVLGRRLNRTIIIPPLFPDHAGGGGKGKRKGKKGGGEVSLVDLYDVTLLLDVGKSPFCVLSEYEFYRLEAERQQRESASVSSASSSVVVPAVCLSMRGISTFPRHPNHFKFECKREVFVKYKKDLRLFLKTATSTDEGDSAGKALSPSSFSSSPNSARVLTVPLMIYYAAKVPLSSVLCVWRLLQPHAVIRDVMDVFREEYIGNYSNAINSDDGQRQAARAMMHGGEGDHHQPPPPPLVVGVHVRSLEGSCDSRIDELEKHAARQQAEMAADAGGPPPPADAAAAADGEGSKDDFADIIPTSGGDVSPSQRGDALARRRQALKSQCVMDPSYVLSVGVEGGSRAMASVPNNNEADAKRGGREADGGPIVVFVADDNQQAQRVNTLVAGLRSSSAGGGGGDGGGGHRNVRSYRLRDVFTTAASSPSERLSAILRSVLGNKWGASCGSPRSGRASSDGSGSGEFTIVRNRFHIFSELLFMQLDFWALAEASDVLVGNQLSTLSLNVCRRRLSVGRRCDNFVGVDGIQ